MNLAKTVIRVDDWEIGWCWRSHARYTSGFRNWRDRERPPVSVFREDTAFKNTHIPLHQPDQRHCQAHTTLGDAPMYKPDREETYTKVASYKEIVSQQKGTASTTLKVIDVQP